MTLSRTLKTTVSAAVLATIATTAFGADIFFDDQPGHVARAAQAVAAGHVPSGVINS